MPHISVYSFWSFVHVADARERITVEIENVGKWFKETGECSAWLAASDDEHLQGVGREVNGPLFNWVVKRLGISGTPAHDMFRRGSPLVGSIQASGRGTPIEPTSLGDLWSLWDSREKDNLELIDSLKDDVLEQELHDLALLDAKLKRMSQPMPVCTGDIQNVKLHPRFGVCQGVKADGTVKVRIWFSLVSLHVWLNCARLGASSGSFQLGAQVYQAQWA